MTRTPKQIAADKVAELIEKLEKAEGPDPTIDAEICLFFQYGGENSVGATNVRIEDDWDGDLLFEINGEDCCNPVPALTASLDAAVALAERMLPGWRICTEFGQNYSIAQFKRGWGPARTEYLGMATTERADDEIALCLCTAALRVRAHMHPRDREGSAS